MKKIIIIFLSAYISLSHATETIKIDKIKKIKDNLYQAEHNIYIQTKYCSKYIYGTKSGLLKYQKNHYDNEIIFDDGTKCKVENVIK